MQKGDKRTSTLNALFPLPMSIFNFPIAKEASTHDLAQPEDYLLHRVLHGIPEGNVDIPPMQALPMDSNLDIMGGGTCNVQPRSLLLWAIILPTYLFNPQLTSGRVAMLARNSQCALITLG